MFADASAWCMSNTVWLDIIGHSKGNTRREQYSSDSSTVARAAEHDSDKAAWQRQGSMTATTRRRSGTVSSLVRAQAGGACMTVLAIAIGTISFVPLYADRKGCGEGLWSWGSPSDLVWAWCKGDGSACMPPGFERDLRVQSLGEWSVAKQCGQIEPGPVLCVANLAVCRDGSSFP